MLVTMQAPWLTHAWGSLAAGVDATLGVPSGTVTAQEVAALWLLCQQQAVLNGCTDAACSLFGPQVRMENWRPIMLVAPKLIG